jgi:hypothetical protein
MADSEEENRRMKMNATWDILIARRLFQLGQGGSK